jgi:uncharacterized protein (TIGR03083 family)
VNTMDMARDERGELVDLLVALTPEQWEAPTLCTQWRVRDVVAHIFSYDELGTPGLVGWFLRGGLKPDRVNAIRVAAYADRSPDELVALAKNNLQPRGLTSRFGGRIALTDGAIHQQDIRRPLGLPREMAPQRLAVVLDFAKTAPPIHAAKRIRGLTLTATDLDWTSGRGPTVEGPAEALLMALAGRRGVTDELSGPGVPALAERIGT